MKINHLLYCFNYIYIINYIFETYNLLIIYTTFYIRLIPIFFIYFILGAIGNISLFVNI